MFPGGDGMTRSTLLPAAAFVLALVFPSASLGEEKFQFYGVEFGMTPEEVKVQFPDLDKNVVRDPGHGMTTLELYFDYEDLLMEIRASYPNPEGRIASLGLQRALSEKFRGPVQEKFPGISVSIDQYGNRAAYTIIFLSTGIREKNIEFYKNEFLKSMQ